MEIQFEVDSLDTVADESLKSVYVEREGKFHFDPDRYAEVKLQSSGLKKKNSDLISENKKIKETAQRYEKLKDFQDGELEELLELREQKKNPPPVDPNKGKGSDELQAQFERSMKKAQEKFDAETTTLKQENADLKRENKHYKLTMPLKDIASKAGVLPDYLDLVMMDTASRFDLNDDGKIIMVDKDGDPTDVEPQKFFSTLYKDDRPHLYAPSGAGGSGAPAATGGGTASRAMRMSDFQKLSPEQQRAFMTDVSGGKAKLID